MGTPAPDAVNRLVDHFDQNRKVLLSGDYKEEHVSKAKSGTVTYYGAMSMRGTAGWSVWSRR
jgi:hypothetical protein